MKTWTFASDGDGEKFSVQGVTLQDAFESLKFRAEDYAQGEDAEEMRGTTMRVWAWDEAGERHDWLATFA